MQASLTDSSEVGGYIVVLKCTEEEVKALYTALHKIAHEDKTKAEWDVVNGLLKTIAI